jgi:hypothetical protein
MLKIEFNTTGRHDDLIEEQAYRGAEVVSRRGRDLEEHPVVASTFHWPDSNKQHQAPLRVDFAVLQSHLVRKVQQQRNAVEVKYCNKSS